MTCPYLEEIIVTGDPELKVRKYCLYFQFEPDEEIDCKNCYIKDTILEMDEFQS
jgi:hypothetical protein